MALNQMDFQKLLGDGVGRWDVSALTNCVTARSAILCMSYSIDSIDDFPNELNLHWVRGNSQLCWISEGIPQSSQVLCQFFSPSQWLSHHPMILEPPFIPFIWIPVVAPWISRKVAPVGLPWVLLHEVGRVASPVAWLFRRLLVISGPPPSSTPREP